MFPQSTKTLLVTSISFALGLAAGCDAPSDLDHEASSQGSLDVRTSKSGKKSLTSTDSVTLGADIGSTDGGTLDGGGAGDTGDTADAGAAVSIPAGSFMMGCNTAVDTSCRADEFPYHLVSLSAFTIDRTEVTQADYQTCVAAGACTLPQANYDPAATPAQPVRDVAWAQAAAYCAWAGKRLPTEAEWERAARGTDGRVYPWGNTTPTCTSANFQGCAAGPVAVGQLPAGASPAGALDMAGNVMEWAADFYSPSYYSSSPSSDPQGPSTGSYRVARGGNFGDASYALRTSIRGAGDPSIAYDGIGFRCAK